ncbi:MAG: phosphoglycerate kinase [Actinomycetales bacterium]|nr:phosphoglycerate kinase [Actinomycetales bacterium]
MLSEFTPTQVAGKRVFLRCDLNVPLDGDRITDDGRIKASLPTINSLLSAGCGIVICAHLGRPKGEVKKELSLAPVANRLSELIGKPVKFITTSIGEVAEKGVLSTAVGEITLLENIRFNPAETSKDENERLALAKELAKGVDFYVGDGFGAVHRKHASVYELAKLLPHASGKLVAAEVQVLQQLMESPKLPYMVVLGGAKVSDKIAVIKNLITRVNRIAIGGGMVFTFLAAKGYSVGKSLLESDSIELVKEILSTAESRGVEVILPTDILGAPTFSDQPALRFPVESIPDEIMGLDIGPDSAKNFANSITSSHTVFWNGPMGVFEFSHFANGTKTIAKALTEVSGLSVVGGGDSAAAIRALGFKDAQFGYVSTGGGASLEYLEGKNLPGLEALNS